MYIPSGSRTSISGPGPLREMVTSCRLGSKGILHVCSPPSSWSVDSRCTLEAWIADSTHFSTWGADVRSRCQRAPVMSCLCLTHPRRVPNRLPAVCRIRFPPMSFRQYKCFPSHSRSLYAPRVPSQPVHGYSPGLWTQGYDARIEAPGGLSSEERSGACPSAGKTLPRVHQANFYATHRFLQEALLMLLTHG